MALLKRARGDSGEFISQSHRPAAGLVRGVDVDCSGVTPVLEELRRMCVSGMSFQKTGYALWMTVDDVLQWIANGHTHTPEDIQKHFGRTLVLTGLEQDNMNFSQADFDVMAHTVSALMRGCLFLGDVDLSINRGEARLLGSRKRITSILAFIRGDCNMKLGRVITCDDGSKVDEISFALLPDDETEFFMSIRLPFYCFYNLCPETEQNIIRANWDGFGLSP
jgi:hypothetical protein